MSITLISPCAKTIALGGVATGSMKAKDEATVDGSMKYMGCRSIETACEKQPIWCAEESNHAICLNCEKLTEAKKTRLDGVSKQDYVIKL